MELLVQTYLRTHSLASLAKEHGVYARVAGAKFSVNYDQLEAKDSDPLACQCRGLILRTKDGRSPDDSEVIGETVVLAYPMDRFFNYGQGAAASVNFEDPDTCFFEKLDGTLIILYWDDLKSEWHIATRGVPEADLPIDGFSTYTFATLFKSALMITAQYTNGWEKYVQILEKAKRYTFCFELMTPHNQVVVRHDTAKVALLAVRHLDIGRELALKQVEGLANMLGVPTAPRHTIKNVQDLLDFVNSRSGLDYEGVVVCDPQHRRVKVKSAAYLVASRAKSVIGASPRNLLELILQDQIDDVMPVLTDEHREKAEKMRADIQAYVQAFDAQWTGVMDEVKALGHLSDHNRRKEFARGSVGHSLWLAPAMAMYENKAKNLRDWIQKQKTRTKDGSFPAGFLDNFLRELSTL